MMCFLAGVYYSCGLTSPVMLGLRGLSVLLTTLTVGAIVGGVPSETHPHCRFPDAVYLNASRDNSKNSQDRMWHINSKDTDYSANHEGRLVDFQGHTIRIHFIKTPLERVNTAGVMYTCTESLGNMKYLVTKQQQGEPIAYTCLQLVLRSPNVLQWRMSAQSEVHSSLLCDENSLRLQDDVFLHYPGSKHSSQREYVPCPLQGGYFISQWGNATHDFTCRTAIPPSKLESECEKGDGIRYEVGKGHCPSPFENNENHAHLICIATWRTGSSTFAVVVNKEKEAPILCMRYPTQHGHSFTADIFSDGTCHSGSDVTQTVGRRSITMSRHLETSVCADDTQACMTRDLQCDEEVSRACRETCDVCPNPRPWRSATIDARFHGTWLMHHDHQAENVTINDRSIHIPSLGKYEVLMLNSCIHETHGFNEPILRYVMVSMSENGCSPRLTAVEIVTRNTAVLSFRLSQSIPISYELLFDPLRAKYQLTNWQNWCGQLKFAAGPRTKEGTHRKGPAGWFNLVKTGAINSDGDCKVPNILHRLRIVFPNGQICNGRLKQNSGNKFNLKLKSCAEDAASPNGPLRNSTMESPIAFTCLAYFHGKRHRLKYLITSSASFANASSLCWNFDVRHGEGHILPVSDCDDDSVAKIRRGHQKTVFAKLQMEDVTRREGTLLSTTTASSPTPSQDTGLTGSATNTHLTQGILLLCIVLLSGH